MRISSRTPEGSPNRCPVCGGEMRIDPSLYSGDAPCPRCGTLLWFVIRPSEGHLFFVSELSEEVRDRVLEIVAIELGVSKHQLESDPSLIEKSGMDSLDYVELVMEIEDELQGRYLS